MLILGFPDYHGPSFDLASALGCPAQTVAVHSFPDGESLVRVPTQLPAHVVLCRSLDSPNGKLVELMLAARAAREAGAARVTLVAPYLCYMRQDMAFEPGQAVSQRIVGKFLAEHFDALITVDPHLHRVHRLDEACPLKQSLALTAAPLMGAFLSARAGGALLVGPDGESEQWVRAVASPRNMDYVVAEKTRHGDHDVEISLPEADYRGRMAVLIDDVASTGQTLATAARELKARGADRIDVMVTHALFVDSAMDLLRQAGVSRVWSSDSVPHPSNALALSPLLAEALRGASSAIES